MTFDVIKEILMWCAIINISFLLISTLALKTNAPAMRAKLYGISEEKMRKYFALVLMQYKLVVVAFFVVPYLVMEFAF